jgi:trimethylamine---corrinoid protein Co-methyltransferase
MRLRKGLSADAEHLAVDIILDVMNGTRNFLGQKHTMKHLRAGELALTKFAERNSWDTWDEKLGRKQMADFAIDEAERILREHEVPPLSPEQEKELDRILATAEVETAKKKSIALSGMSEANAVEARFDYGAKNAPPLSAT